MRSRAAACFGFRGPRWLRWLRCPLPCLLFCLGPLLLLSLLCLLCPLPRLLLCLSPLLLLGLLCPLLGLGTLQLCLLLFALLRLRLRLGALLLLGLLCVLFGLGALLPRLLLRMLACLLVDLRPLLNFLLLRSLALLLGALESRWLRFSRQGAAGSGFLNGGSALVWPLRRQRAGGGRGLRPGLRRRSGAVRRWQDRRMRHLTPLRLRQRGDRM